jgi:hypothetical protein
MEIPVHENTEVTNIREGCWSPRPVYGGCCKEIKTSWMCPSLADQTAGFERSVVVVQMAKFISGNRLLFIFTLEFSLTMSTGTHTGTCNHIERLRIA